MWIHVCVCDDGDDDDKGRTAKTDRTGSGTGWDGTAGGGNGRPQLLSLLLSTATAAMTRWSNIPILLALYHTTTTGEPIKSLSLSLFLSFLVFPYILSLITKINEKKNSQQHLKKKTIGNWRQLKSFN